MKSWLLQVREFLESLPPAAVLADVGCGNGKYFGVRPDVAILGSDRSPNLAETASKRSACSLPLFIVPPLSISRAQRHRTNSSRS